MYLFAHSTHTYTHLYKPRLHVYYLSVLTDIHNVILDSDLLALLWRIENEDF